MIDEEIVEELSTEIENIFLEARKNVQDNINFGLLQCYWNIGAVIIENKQLGSLKAEYGKSVLLNLSKKLTRKLGKGFSRSNLQNMRLLYLDYPKFEDLPNKLTWSHACELVSIDNENERKFYEKETVNSNWSVRELKKQIEKSLYERLLLSEGSQNKETVLKLAKEGRVLNEPSDILKDPYVFDFLGMAEQKPILEKELEYKLIRHIEDFLLELGKGFMYVGSQQRITIDNVHYYVDMVFYNKMLKCYVLIDLKIGKLKPENMGQMNMYLNYYEKEINSEDDGKPIGIVLCAKKDEVVAEYATEGFTNNIFASKYTYYIPNKEQLIKEVEKVLSEDEE